MKNIFLFPILFLAIFLQSLPGFSAPAGSLVVFSPSNLKPPTIQKFTSGSGTYTTPAGVTWIQVRMVGAGGGGAGGGATQPNGSNGGTTTFGTSLLSASGGLGSSAYAGGSPGSGSISSPAYGTALTGGTGGNAGANSSSSAYPIGGAGGNSVFGGGGNGGTASGGSGAAANSGAGGGGGSGANVTGHNGGGGGGAGGFVDAIIPSPASSYSYTVGAAGPGGAAGTSGNAGASGSAGYIEVTEHYGTNQVPIFFGPNHQTTDVLTSAYTILPSDTIVQADTTSGAFTLTLPSAATAKKGKLLKIKKVDSSGNLLTISGSIAGSNTSTVLHRKGEVIELSSDGSTWQWESDNYRTEYVVFAGNTIPSGVCSGANTVCSTVHSSGNWYSSIVRNASVTGLYDVTVKNGIFPSRASCSVSVGWGGVQSYGSGSASMYSTTALTMQTFAAAGTATDAIAQLTCRGLR